MTSTENFVNTDIGLLPQNWEIKKLPDVLSFIVDNRGKTAPTSDNGIALIATNCIKEDALYPVKEKIRFVNQNTFSNWFRAHPQPNDIIFVNKGTPGLVCLVPDPVDFCIAQDMVALRPDETKIYNKYLFAYLRSPQFKNQVQGLNVGTTIPHLKKTLFDKLLIPIPTRLEQELIGDIYFYLSNQIELNLKMNLTLESIDQAIFKQWFVDFQFPGATGELKNGLLKGWSIGRLDNVIDLVYGKGLKEENRIQGKYPVVGSNGIVGYHNQFLVEGPGIVIGRKGTIGEVIWIEENFTPIDTTFYIKDAMGLKELFFHYYLLLQQDFKKITSDSAVPGLNRNSALSTEVIVPTVEIISKFNDLIRPCFNKIQHNIFTNNILIKIRDSLLPKLITGQIQVN
jgi:type I restriction enzyme S subunit